MSTSIQRDTLAEAAHAASLSPTSTTADYAEIPELGVTAYYQARCGRAEYFARAWATQIGASWADDLASERLPYRTEDVAVIAAALDRVARRASLILRQETLRRAEVAAEALAEIERLAPTLAGGPIGAFPSLVDAIVAALEHGVSRERIAVVITEQVASRLLPGSSLAETWPQAAAELWIGRAEQYLEESPQAAATTTDLIDAAHAQTLTREQAERALTRRDNAIRAALAAGVRRDTIERITGVSKGRISQIKTEVRADPS